MKCLMLAGGFAVRLYPITRNKAKALLEFKGKPVISHMVEKVPRNVDIMVSTNKKFETDFRNWQTTLNRPVEICFEQSTNYAQKLGAVAAIDFWIKNKHITDDLMVIAADNFAELDLSDFIGGLDSNTALIAVHDVGDKEKACEINKACQLGVVIIEGNKVIRFDEKPPKTTSSIVATGMYIFPTRIFPLLAEYCQLQKQDNLGNFISYLINRESVHAYAFTQTWIDIGDEIKKGRLSVR